VDISEKERSRVKTMSDNFLYPFSLLSLLGFFLYHTNKHSAKTFFLLEKKPDHSFFTCGDNTTSLFVLSWKLVFGLIGSSADVLPQ